jgi:hypothetical protein
VLILTDLWAWGGTCDFDRAGLLRLPAERDSDGTTQYNRLKQTAQAPTWSHFKRLFTHLEWLDKLGDTSVWVDGVAAPKVTDFAGEADAADASELRDYAVIKRVALLACLAHKARTRVRDDLATMLCKRVAMKIKKAKEELEEIRLAEREIVEALIGNYRTVLKNIDADGPAQAALERAAGMTAEAVKALDGLDEAAPVEELARRLGGDVSPAVLTLMQAQLVQAGGLGAVTKAVEGFGGFAGQYEQIEKVSAHHGNFWEVLLYGQLGRDRSVMFDLAEKLKFTATSEDGRVLSALAHARRHESARGEYISALGEDGKTVDISFAIRPGITPLGGFLREDLPPSSSWRTGSEWERTRGKRMRRVPPNCGITRPSSGPRCWPALLTRHGCGCATIWPPCSASRLASPQARSLRGLFGPLVSSRSNGPPPASSTRPAGGVAGGVLLDRRRPGVHGVGQDHASAVARPAGVGGLLDGTDPAGPARRTPSGTTDLLSPSARPDTSPRCRRTQRLPSLGASRLVAAAIASAEGDW